MNNPAPQLDLLAGLEARNEGLERVEMSNQEFVGTMRSYARRICMSSKEGFVTSDALRIKADELGIYPNSPNAWGAIFSGNDWKCVGRQKSTYKSNHAREIKQWQYIGGKS